MQIAIDARWLNRGWHGIAKYTYHLLQELPLTSSDNLIVIYNRKDFEPFQKPGLIWLDASIPLFSRQESWQMTKLLASLKLDILHIPSYWKPYKSPCPWFITIHDLIHLQESNAKYKLYYRFLRQHLQSSAGILTVSQASADAIHKWSGHPASVIYPGVADYFKPEITNQQAEQVYLKSLGICASYFLYIGNAKAHKNAQWAFDISASLKTPHQLVTLGLPQTGQVDHLALKNISDQDLAILYRHASALLLPSLIEGFGLPGAEAWACNCPVLASDIAVFREVFPQSTLLPLDHAEKWRQAMQACLDEKKLSSSLIPQQINEATLNNSVVLGLDPGTHFPNRMSAVDSPVKPGNDGSSRNEKNNPDNTPLSNKFGIKTYSWQRMAQETYCAYQSKMGVS